MSGYVTQVHDREHHEEFTNVQNTHPWIMPTDHYPIELMS